MTRPLKVLKFGGTSVGHPARLRNVVQIVTDAAMSHRLVVVASAASGVTDQLVAAFDEAGRGSCDVPALVATLADRHRAIAAALLNRERQDAYAFRLEALLGALGACLKRVDADGATPEVRDEVLSYGERIMVPLVSFAFEEAGLTSVSTDATVLVRTDATYGEAIVDRADTYRQVQSWYAGLGESVVPVVTGFIGSTPDGLVTTLGRSGSDYTAALLAAALQASVLERWTDTDGIYTDDPHRNQDAKRLAYIVLEEAWAWNQAGRLGMHRKALDPLVAAGIPVHVRSTESPERSGTLILPAGWEKRATVAVG